MSNKYNKSEVAESLVFLRDWIKEGQTVYCVNRRTSKSGMMRLVSMHVITPGTDAVKEPYLNDITFHAARVMDYGFDRDMHALRVNGCGMDMHWAAVESLGYAVFNKAGSLRKQTI